MEAICYTDGSARPNNSSGFSGYGVHIVILDPDKKPKNVFTKYGLTEQGYLLKSDIKKNKELKEYGIYKVYEIYGYKPTSFTNNQAELDAIKQAYKAITIFNEKDNLDIDKITILADSTYCLNFLNKMLKETFDIDDVKVNKDDVNDLYKAFNSIKDKFELAIGKVPAHSGNLGNDRADLLSNMGRLRNLAGDSKTEYIHEDANDFWKLPNIDMDVFYFKQLFRFYPDDSHSDIYYGLNYKDESDMGKKISYVTYTILKLPKPDPIVEVILTKIRETLKENYVPYIVNMQNLTNKKNLFNYLKYGEHIVIARNKPYLSLETLDGIELARVLYPTGLSNIVMDNMEKVKDDVITYVQNEPRQEEYIDITDLIYETNDKGKNVIKKDIINDKYILPYKLEHAKLKIKMKYDLPPRNLLRRLESKEPKVTLIVRDAGPVYEYKTMVTTADGSLIYTSNIYSNKIIKKIKKGK